MKRAVKWIWVALTTILAVIVYVLWPGLDNQKLQKMVKDVTDSALKEKETTKEIKDRVKSRDLEQQGRRKRAENLTKKLGKFFAILLLVSILTPAVLAEENPYNLAIPDDYETLLLYYKEMANIALEYKTLYEEAEAALIEAQEDIKILLESQDRLQKLITTQQGIINQLMKRKALSIETGVNFVPLDPGRSGIIVGLNWQF